jgi:Uma2 family endonuclease
MSIKKPKVRFTYRDYCLLPEDKRYELMDGELYMAPAPGTSHQTAVRNLGTLLWNYVRQNRLGQVHFAPYDVILSDEDVVQPDVLFVSQERRSIISERGCEGPPDLVVEVLSPSTAQRDRELKRKVYARYGVREYWLVDPETQTVEVLALDAEDLTPQGAYSAADRVASQVLPGLTLPVGQVFRTD